jgi:hypothetical protein
MSIPRPKTAEEPVEILKTYISGQKIDLIRI